MVAPEEGREFWRAVDLVRGPEIGESGGEGVEGGGGDGALGLAAASSGLKEGMRVSTLG